MNVFANHLSLLLLLVYTNFILCARNFRLGRIRGGNIGSPGITLDSDLPKAQWFTQKVDHFSPTDLRTWNQRYFVNDSYYEYGLSFVPIYLMLGGEGLADPRWMVQGTWLSYCMKDKGLCFYLEHRYYGESKPTKDMSTKNLLYLNSQQALADIASFINGMVAKYKINPFSRWIVFGGSYSGSLAAWSRVKYPHLVHGAVASSAPLLALADFRDYYTIVLKSIDVQSGSQDCKLALRQAHREIKALVQSQPETIEREFRLCQKLSNASKDDVATFYESIASNFAELVQYNEDNRISMDEKYRNITIHTVCHNITTKGHSEAFQRVAAFSRLSLEKAKEPCMDISYNNMIKELQNTTWNGEGARQWMYQTCSEFGFYQTSDNVAAVFGNDFQLNYFLKQCEDIFGTKFSTKFVKNAIDWTNVVYGGLAIDYDRIVFVDGTVDPWTRLAVSSYLKNVVLVNGTAHCADMYPPRSTDRPELKKARLKIMAYVNLWNDMA